MSAYQVSTNTLDTIVQAAYKYKVISKRERTLFGRMLWLTNQQGLVARYQDQPATLDAAVTAYPAFTPFPRKQKRAAISGAIGCFNYQCSEDHTYLTGEVKRLLDIVAEKNAVAAGYDAVTEMVEAYDDNGERVMDWAGEPGFTTEVVTTAARVMERAVSNDSSIPDFWDITADQRDPDSTDYAASMLVRPIEIVRAERDAEAERIRAERMARTAAAVLADDADDEDDDWDLDEDQDDELG